MIYLFGFFIFKGFNNYDIIYRITLHVKCPNRNVIDYVDLSGHAGVAEEIRSNCWGHWGLHIWHKTRDSSGDKKGGCICSPLFK